MKPNLDTENGQIAALAIAANGVTTFTAASGREFVGIPDGMKLTEITTEDGQPVATPIRIKQGITLQTKRSLVEYVKRFALPDSVLLANIDNDSIAGLIDYHGPATAAFVQHRAALKLSRSVEWKSWADIDGKMMDQQDFARFLEENAADVLSPQGADLLEIVKDMQAVRRADFRKVVRTSGDIESFEYVEETEAVSKAKSAAGKIEIPTKFMLSIPVYFGETEVSVYAFLRWKLTEGNLTLGIKLHRPEHIRQAVFQQIVLDVASDTAVSASYFGALA